MSNRRNRSQRNRKHKIKLDFMSNEKFWMISCSLLLLILLIFFAYKMIDKGEIEKAEKQRQELETTVNNVYESAINQLEQVDEYKTDKIIRITALGNLLCNETLTQNGDGYNKLFDKFSKTLLKDSNISIYNLKKYSGLNDFVYYQTLNNANKSMYISMGIEEDINPEENRFDFKVFGLKSDDLEKKVTKANVRSETIALLAYSTYNENCNIYSEESVKQDLENAKKSTNTIIVSMNWKSGDNKKEIANFLIQNGAKVVLGYDKDSIGSYEIIKNSQGEDCFVAYSIGDFDSIEKTEVLFNIQIFVDKQDNSYVYKTEYKPIYIKDNGSDSEERYEVVDVNEEITKYENGKSEISENEYKKLIKKRDEINNKISK